MKWNTFLLLLFVVQLSAQSPNPNWPDRLHSAGSTLFMLMNFAPDPPQYYQLNYGYWLTQQSVLSIEVITWTYKGPLGRPYGPHFDNPDSNFPGKVRAAGAGLAYKRFWWRHLYTQVHATILRQHYLDPSGGRIGRGFQLFNTIRLGYQLQLFNSRCYIEPSIAMTFWPINTNLPPDFQVEEDRWNKYFLGEPGLHFGINF